MSKSNLDSRQKAYEFNYDIKLMKRVPIIIRVDGKGFSKVTKNLEKPYSATMLGLMGATLRNVISEIDGAVFGYQQSDEVTFVLKNDQSLNTDPWFGNRVQKLTSVTASMMTYHFNKLYGKLEPGTEINLVGNIYFDARAFTVPDISEAANNLVFRQKDCIKNAVQRAAQFHFQKLKGSKTAQGILHKKNTGEQKDLLLKEFNIDFNKIYPLSYINGISAYKIPKLMESNNETVKRNKWCLDFETPIFTEKREWLMSILDTGSDIFRAE